ncbi:MAG: threonylcarbamoyl-AMP synthase [Bacteroidetes bacterium]|nr:MAG: threonylcarbamoyl-AMP synthase [Bacteroidota bacterium]
MVTVLGNDIERAKSLLDRGELVAIPTETVYGLAANALNEAAVLNIFKAKNRPQFNPLIIHLPFWQLVKQYVRYLPPAAQELAMHFSPGPITYLLPKKDILPDLLTAGHPKVAVRIPAHPLTLQLLRSLNYPLAAPSANPFGYVSPTLAQHVLQGLNGKIPYVLDGGQSSIGVESTIVDFEGDAVVIRRLGGISQADIETTLGKKVQVAIASSDHPVAPGMLNSHYATQTPLVVGHAAQLLAQFPQKNILVMGFGSMACTPGYNLSPQGSTDEAARNLFAMMRQADAAGADLIVAPKLPHTGLGPAINDRLLRAQHHQK